MIFQNKRLAVLFGRLSLPASGGWWPHPHTNCGGAVGLIVVLPSCSDPSLLPVRLRPHIGRCYPRLPDPTSTETNAAVLKRRQKQIQYGKNTSGYQNYVQQVPK